MSQILDVQEFAGKIDQNEEDAEIFNRESGLENGKLQKNTNLMAIMGHFHQSTPEQFKHAAAGSQCTSNCLVAIVAASIKSVEKWDSDFIDKVLVGGDELHLSILQRKGWPLLRNESRLDIDEIPESIQCKIGSSEIHASVGVLEEASFGYSSYIDAFVASILVNRPNQNFILRMFGSSVAIICREYQKYSVFDPHARNKNGFIDADGCAGLFHFDNSSAMVDYLKHVSEDRNEQIDLYPISVNILTGLMHHIETAPVHKDNRDVETLSERQKGPRKSNNLPTASVCSERRSPEQYEPTIPTTSMQQDLVLSKSKKNAKPKRPCPFCGEMKGRLTDHLKAKHKTEEKVQNALLLPKDLRNRAFAEMKKEGIFRANSEKLKSGNIDMSTLIRERNQGKSTSLKMCSVCKGFFNASLIYKHKNSCVAAEGSTIAPSAVSVRNLVEDNTYSDEYRQDILESFRDSDYGNLIRSDDWIKRYGFHLYQNIQGSLKKVEKRLALNSKLRRLAHLFLEFQKVFAEKKNRTVESCSEMFDREHILELQEAVIRMTIYENTKTFKNGLKLNIKYLLQDVSEVMQASYLIRREDDKAEEMGKFMIVARRLWSSFFKVAEESVLTKRQEELRAPINLPLKRDLIKLKDYTKQIIENLTGDGYTLFENPEFCKLRDALVCRLTVFNARRGGEPSRMLLSELVDAMNDKWLNQYQKESIQNVIERQLLCETKIAYIRASKIAKLVPVLIPKDCWKALNIVTDVEVRRSAGVNPNNTFVFPNTKTSLSHVVGWDCVNRMCREAGLERNLNATGMRHFMATEYAALDVAPGDRELFFKHMGHSETINENVYQCPPALREITHVGRVLTQVDRMDECEGSLNLLEQNITNVDLDALEEFIGLLAEDIPILELLDSSRQIQENEVTIQPENMKQSKNLLLNKKVQEFAKPFFTEDAWLAVENTLQMLDDTQIPKPAKEGNSSSELKRKTKIDDTLEEEVPGPSGTKIPRTANSEYDEDGLPSAKEAEFLPNFQINSSEDESSDAPEVEEEEIKSLKGLNAVKKPRHVWLPEEDEAILNFFQSEIGDVSNIGNKGKLQVTKKIHQFIKENPGLLKDYTFQEKVKKIRIKLINLRRLNRERFFKNLKKLQHN